MIDFVHEPFGYVPLYARIDMVSSTTGHSQLMELKLAEPSLYLHADPVALDRTARALVSAVTATQR